MKPMSAYVIWSRQTDHLENKINDHLKELAEQGRDVVFVTQSESGTMTGNEVDWGVTVVIWSKANGAL